MKIQNNRNRQSFLLITISIIFLLGSFSATFAQNGIGEKYEARDPKTCADTKKPTRGAISAAQATEYIICGKEKDEGGHLTLVENLKVQLGAATPFNRDTFGYAPDVDAKFPVYPFRASLDMYQCNEVSDSIENRGKSCTVYVRPKATGVCVKTTFGDWRCELSGFDVGDAERKFNMPPPGAAKTVAVRDQSVTPKVNQQTAETKTDANENKDENGFPKPDFSEMEKYYEIVKYEYDPIKKRLNFVAKPKKESCTACWVINFYDADGIKVTSENFVIPVGTDYALDQPMKFYADMPFRESQMKQARKVVITRKVD